MQLATLIAELKKGVYSSSHYILARELQKTMITYASGDVQLCFHMVSQNIRY